MNINKCLLTSTVSDVLMQINKHSDCRSFLPVLVYLSNIMIAIMQQRVNQDTCVDCQWLYLGAFEPLGVATVAAPAPLNVTEKCLIHH